MDPEYERILEEEQRLRDKEWKQIQKRKDAADYWIAAVHGDGELPKVRAARGRLRQLQQQGKDPLVRYAQELFEFESLSMEAQDAYLRNIKNIDYLTNRRFRQRSMR